MGPAHFVGGPSLAGNDLSDTGANWAIRDLMAAQTHAHSSLDKESTLASVVPLQC